MSCVGWACAPVSAGDSVQTSFVEDSTASSCSAVLSTVRGEFTSAYGKVSGALQIQQDGHELISATVGDATLSTRFLVGSVTKTLEAVVTMRRVQSGELKLDQPVWDDLPAEFQAQASSVEPRWRAVTLGKLLNHSAGVVDYLNDSAMPEGWLGQPHSFLEILRSVRLPFLFEPGSNLSYSNTGYFVIGQVLERRLGHRFDELLEAEVVRPLALPDTGALLQPQAGVRGDSSVSLANMMGVGNAYSSSADLMKVLNALDRDELLTEATRQRMWAPDPACPTQKCARYGIGFSLRKGWISGNRDLVLHEGHLRTVSAVIAKVPSLRLNLALLSNVPEVNQGDTRVQGWLNQLIAAGCVAAPVPVQAPDPLMARF